VRIIKRFEFDHARMTMAAAVLDEATQEVHIFLKGSYEKIQELSVTESVPTNYDQVTSAHASDGCYTLGLAHRFLGKVDIESVRTMSRDEMEQGNSCLGLILFRNQMKPDTPAAILAIKEGAVRPVMITGDNALTGMYIAKASNMCDPSATIILGQLRKNFVATKGSGDIFWTNTTTGQEVGDIDQVLAASSSTKSSSSDVELGGKVVELAVTGAAFRALIDSGKMKDLLLHTRIFSRMTPVDKVTCVQLHMEIGITAMCGDGGNDCGALRAAHAGLALSDAEASIVSPFSTSDKSIFTAVEVLKEGRAALATSFASYKFLIQYGETIVMSKLLYSYFSVSLSEWVWIVCDSFFVVTLAYTMALSKPAARLAPKRPTASLLGPETIASSVGTIMINTIFSWAAIFWLASQEFYVCSEFDSTRVDITQWRLLADNYEGEVLGFVVLYQVITSAFVGNFGFAYRESWFKNYPFVIAWILSFVLITCMVILPPNSFGCWFRFNCGNPEALVALGYFTDVSEVTWEITPYNNPFQHNVLPEYFRNQFFIYCLANIVLVCAYQYFVILGPVRNWAIATYRAGKKQIKC
jgi:magnesium-transporting ATPase (P-type)